MKKTDRNLAKCLRRKDGSPQCPQEARRGIDVDFNGCYNLYGISEYPMRLVKQRG